MWHDIYDNSMSWHSIYGVLYYEHVFGIVSIFTEKFYVYIRMLAGIGRMRPINIDAFSLPPRSESSEIPDNSFP